MRFLTLEYIKKHSRIDFDIEDDLLELYGESAEETVLNVLGRSYEDVVISFDGFPDALRHAALMLVDLSYQQRSPMSMASLYVVPYTFDMIVKPYMKLAKGNDDGLPDGCDLLADCEGRPLADKWERILVAKEI